MWPNWVVSQQIPQVLALTWLLFVQLLVLFYLLLWPEPFPDLLLCRPTLH
jgi:hypothetical protein